MRFYCLVQNYWSTVDWSLTTYGLLSIDLGVQSKDSGSGATLTSYT